MRLYRYPGKIFKKYWYWFTAPSDKLTGDLVNVFSYEDVSVAGFKKKVAPTTLIDLSRSQEELWEAMRKRYVREQIEKGKRNGIVVNQTDDWHIFKPIYLEFRKGKKLVDDDPRVFEHMHVVSAYYNGAPIAGGAFVFDRDHARAYALASLRFNEDGKMREIVGQANRMVVWETMLWAKAKGIKTFDLGGIAPDSTDPQDKSLLEFKEAFGGERVNAYYYRSYRSKMLKLFMKIKSYLSV